MIFKKWHMTSLSKKWLLVLGGICMCFIAYDLLLPPPRDAAQPLIETAEASPAAAETQESAPAGQETAPQAEAEETAETEPRDGDFFAAYRVEREQVRARENEMLDKIMNSEQVSADAKEAANSRKLAITAAMDQEMQLENLIRAKNYSEAAVFIQDGSATVVVRGKLDDRGAIVIADLVQGIAGIGMEKLVIMEK